MALLMDEDQVWKCLKHPSRRRKTGICPKCLRDRLVTLCPECANARPCACSPPPPDSSSSSSAAAGGSTFSLFSFSRGGSRHESGQFSSNNVVVDVNPALRKSRSVAPSFLRSRSRYVGNGNGNGVEIRSDIVPPIDVTAVKSNESLPPKASRSKINNIWSVFTSNKSKKCDVNGERTEEEVNNGDDMTAIADNSMMMRSRSVAVGGGNRFSPASSKHKGWYFPSPINALRHSKPPVPVA